LKTGVISGFISAGKEGQSMTEAPNTNPMSATETAVAVSVVLPVHNEAENLEAVWSELRQAMEGLGEPWEAVFVDDGSTDASARVLHDLAAAGDRLRVIELVRNYGQTQALAAGIDAAVGAIIVGMDADGQNDPADIPRLVAAVRRHGGVASGWRRRRRDGLLLRRLPSRLANALISRVTGVRLHDYGCTLKAYERAVFDGFEFYGDAHRLIPVYAAMRGYGVREMEVNHRPRRRGRSHYGLGRTWSLVVDILTARFVERSLHRPMHLFGKWGLWALALAAAAAAFVVVRKVLVPHGEWISPMFFVAVMLALAGFQLIALGLIAALVAPAYHRAAGRRPYEVKKPAHTDAGQQKPPMNANERR
jgi:glycosyltransferase involved in cell wall biosynthesis